VSDVEFDRGRSARPSDLERLSETELLQFIAPKESDIVLDAGCGSGVNIELLNSRVGRVLAMDFAEGAVARCQNRCVTRRIHNVAVLRGDVTTLPVSNAAVDKVLCMSVLQYLDDAEVTACFAEFARVLKPHGILILHVKNLSSLYLSTLWLAKQLKRLLRRHSKLEYFRTYGWYAKRLKASGFEIAYYNSFNIFMLEALPAPLLWRLQRLELSYHSRFPFNLGSLRRSGSDLKIKARMGKGAR
jgi:ubiquinone/menaquinone biosynthesis C-methylase UbiE